MPTCPTCGAATAAAPSCGNCGAPLTHSATGGPDLVPLRTVAGALLGVAIFVAASGLVLLGSSGWWAGWTGDGALYFPLGIVVAGGVGIVAASFLLARRSWAWGLAVGVVAFGIVYAASGLVRGYSSGFLGLAVWGALGYGLWRPDVRAAVGP